MLILHNKQCYSSNKSIAVFDSPMFYRRNIHLLAQQERLEMNKGDCRF